MFRKNKVAISVAVGILGVAGIMTSAQAVHVNPDGTGQALLFPYFNAQDGYVTNVNIVNSTDQTKAVKIRFKEGRTSNDVLDFNIYMSPEDVWTGSIQTAEDEKGNPVGSIATADRSCTLPILVDCKKGECASKPVPFRGHGVFPGVTAADTREGYIEVIEMGVVEDTAVKEGVLHVNGTPTDCSTVSTAWTKGGFAKGDGSAAKGLSAPTGGLFGSSAVINVSEGSAFAVDPVAIDNYSTQAQHYRPDDANFYMHPSLASGNVDTSSVMIRKPSGETEMVVTKWKQLDQSACINAARADKIMAESCGKNPYPVAHVLLAPHLMNEYFLDPAFGYDGHTDWVVTFPMKKYGIFTAENDIVGTFENGIFDREEGRPGVPEEPGDEFGFSPPIGNSKPDPIDPTSKLLREVNVLSFKSTAQSEAALKHTVLSSPVAQDISVGPFVYGWARLSFPNYSLKDGFISGEGYGAIGKVPYDAASNVYKGVPAVGAAFVEGNVSENAHARFGDALPHKIQRD